MSRDNEFWRYSLQVYAQPGVAELALNWQNQYGVNVNVLLWCDWLESQNIALTEKLLSSALAGIEAWDDNVVKALRDVRQTLAGLPARMDFLPIINSKIPIAGEGGEKSLRPLLLAAELDAEKSLQAWLYERLVAYLAEPVSLQRHADAECTNVAVYLGRVLAGEDAAAISNKAMQWKKLCAMSEAL